MKRNYGNDDALSYDQEANKLNSTVVANSVVPSVVHTLFDDKTMKSQCSKNNV